LADLATASAVPAGPAEGWPANKHAQEPERPLDATTVVPMVPVQKTQFSRLMPEWSVPMRRPRQMVFPPPAPPSIVENRFRPP